MKRRTDNLATRVESRKRQLITEIIEHKKNSSRPGAAEAIARINRHLSELSQISSGGKCTDLSAGAKLRLAQWVAR